MKKTKMLKKNYQFRNVLSKGKYYSGEYIEAFIKKNKFKINFIGIAISVKLAKAVKRNKIKRIIRECYRLQEFKLKSGFTIVFLWKKNKEIDKGNFKNIKNDLINIFDKAGIIEEKYE